MRYSWGKRLTAGLSAGLLMAGLAGCSSEGTGPADPTPVIPVSDKAFVSRLPADAAAGTYASGEEERAALDQMSLQLENEAAALYLNETYFDIAVLDKRTGRVWFSNPAVHFVDPKAEATPEARAEAYSQIFIEFYNETGERQEMSSYPDAVDGVDRFQAEYTCENDVLTVTYTLGKRMDDLVIAPILREESYNRLMEDAQRLVDEGVLMPGDYGTARDSYSRLSIDDEDAADYLEEYPQLKEHGVLYVLAGELSEVVQSRVDEVFRAAGWDAQAVKAEEEAVGGAALNTDTPNFTVALQYSLQMADLLVTVPTDSIEESEGMYLHRIDFLRSMGATREGTDGYLLVPDGSGALLYNDGGSFDQKQLELAFYGSDYGMDLYDESLLLPDAALPVYGIQGTNAAVFAIAESGEANGGLEARLSDSQSSYNRVGNWLEYRAMDTAYLNGASGAGDEVADEDKMTWDSEMTVFAQEPSRSDYRVRYHFLYGDQAGYTGMAAYYQSYLEQTGVLSRDKAQTDSRLIVDIVGTIDKRKQVLGFPVDGKEALTTFEQAGALLDGLYEAGIGDISVRLEGWMNGGMASSLPNRVKVQKELGGADGLQSLQQQIEQAGGRLYPAVDIGLTYSGKESGFQSGRDAMQLLNKKVALTGVYNPATGRLAEERQAILVNTSSFDWILDGFFPAYAELGLKGISASGLGRRLGGNYQGSAFVCREQAKRDTQEALERMTAEGYGLQLELGNAYVLAYAQELIDVPLTDSGLRITDQSVPFVAMVLHGYLPFAGSPMNLEQDLQTAFLQAAEAGAAMQFKLMAAENMTLKNTDYEGSFADCASAWEERITALYQRMDEDFAGLWDQRITGHRRDGELAVVTYENGARVYVNYGNSATAADGLTVPAMDYLVVR